MKSIHLLRLSTSVERGYLVYAGQSLGVGDNGGKVELDADVVVLDIATTEPGWIVTFFPVDVRWRLGPAA